MLAAECDQARAREASRRPRSASTPVNLRRRSPGWKAGLELPMRGGVPWPGLHWGHLRTAREWACQSNFIAGEGKATRWMTPEACPRLCGRAEGENKWPTHALPWAAQNGLEDADLSQLRLRINCSRGVPSRLGLAFPPSLPSQSDPQVWEREEPNSTIRPPFWALL